MRHDSERRAFVVGAGLAGSEAAWQLATRGIPVTLLEMRPSRMTEAHVTHQCAELVCSNSFGSDAPNSASRILKDEMQSLGSFILRTARQAQVPAGASLAVDRDLFSAGVTSSLEALPNITREVREVTEIPLLRENEVLVIATGPLTSRPLCEAIARLVGAGSLYFYDAISPIVSADSLDLEKMFFANRYNKGESEDFLNVPLSREQYETLVDDLLAGEVVVPHDFEEEKYFEGCMPIEAIAARGRKTLAFGPLRPVGLFDPKGAPRAHAVIQLRTENRHRTAYNLVGFQTKLKYKEQERVFRKLPGLEKAEFLRLGSMHRNTFLNSPAILSPTLQLRSSPRTFVAGQLTGTEGYLESAATGLLAGMNAARVLTGEAPIILSPVTMLGALLTAITDPTRGNFQPMNANIGVLLPLETAVKDKQARNAAFAKRSLESLLSLSVNDLIRRRECDLEC